VDSLIPLLAQSLTSMTPFVIGGIVAVVLFVLIVILLTALVRVCPPNMVMVVTGAPTKVDGKSYGFRLQKGGWTMVIPYFQQAQFLDLSIIPVNVRVEGVNSANGITVGADATACVCVDDEDQRLLYAAVERLMGKSRREIQDQIQQTMIGNFRGALNKTTPLEAIGMVESVEKIEAGELPDDSDRKKLEEGERAQFRYELLRDSNEDLSAFGMRVVSVSLQKIWDTSSYIANLANKSLSRKRQDIDVEEARLKAQAEEAESDSASRREVSRNEADERIVQAREELEVARRECQAQIEQARLEAEGAISRAQSEGSRHVQEQLVHLQQLKNRSEITMRAEADQRAAEILAEGESEAIRVVEGTRNDLFQQKALLVAQAGDAGRIALFVQQHLPILFQAYDEHARHVRLDHVVVMDDKDALNHVINRGPLGMVDFLRQLQAALGIDVRQLLSETTPPQKREEVTA
jgi:regulator of protease activity HflC (stomatin/prohibitin superfamily)